MRSSRYKLVLATGLVGSLLLPSGGAGAPVWLSPQAAEAASLELAEKLGALDTAPGVSAEERLEAARVAVAGLAATLDAWGLPGVLERAPIVTAIEIPATDDRRLEALARWGACSLPLDPIHAETQEEVFRSALGGTAGGLVSVFLVTAYRQGGGTAEGLRGYLASDALNAASARVHEDDALRVALWNECVAALRDLLGE